MLKIKSITIELADAGSSNDATMGVFQGKDIQSRVNCIAERLSQSVSCCKRKKRMCLEGIALQW